MRLKRHCRCQRLLASIDLKCYSDLLFANMCNARDFATKISDMTATTKLGRKNYRRAIDVATIAVAIGIVGVGITEDFMSCNLCKITRFVKEPLSILRSHPTKRHWAFHYPPVLHTRAILFLLSFKFLKLIGDF